MRLRWPWTRHHDAEHEETAEAARVKRLKQRTEALTDRLAQAADQLEQALEQPKNQTMQPGEQRWRT